MEQDPVFFILKGPSYPPAEEAKTMLGRVVKNFAQPIADYVPKDASNFRDEEPNITELSSAMRTSIFAKLREWEGRFLSLTETSGQTGFASYSNIENSVLKVWELRGQDDCFLRLMQDSAVAARVKKWAKPRRNPVYMIVGLLVWESAKLTHVESREQNSGVEADLPVGTAAAAALAAHTGLSLSSEAIGDIKLKRQSENSSTVGKTSESKEGRIFGIQCRNVRTRYSKLFKSETELEAAGPRVNADRMYDADQTEATASETTDEEMYALLEPSDVLWTDAIEDLEDAIDVELHRIGDEEYVTLAFADP